MYQVLYRKWRPQTFSEVYGQPHITTALKNELTDGRLSHAYLFTGSRGTGKTSCAKILAKAVNCTSLVDGDPCNACDMCRGIDSGAIMDVVEIDAASNNGVDNIRELREEVNFTPAVAKYRVYIIDEVHMLSPGAFNALLKTLEEPPAHVIFILATTEVHKLPATILSRCQRFDFHRIAPADIASRIQFVAEQESFTVAEDAALLLARLADGAMRDALSLLDQCISRTRDVTLETVLETTGMAGREHLFTLSAAVRNADTGEALALIDQLYESSRDMERLCAEWIDYFRNLMICKSVRTPQDLIVAPPSEIARMAEEADGFTLPAILHCLHVLQDTLQRLRAGVSRRIEMEMAVLKLCAPELDTDVEGLTRRVKELENNQRAGQSVAAPIMVPVSPPNAPPISARPSAPPEATLPEEPFPEWVDVLAVLAVSCAPLYGVLVGSTAARQGEHIVISTANDMFKTLVRQDGNVHLLTSAIQKVTGQSYRIGIKKHVAEPTVAASNDPLSAFLQESRELGVDIQYK